MKTNNKNIGVESSIVGVGVNAILVLLKFLVGLMYGSVSILADALNNLSDLLSSMIAFVGFLLGKKPADKEHPFGHERFEYVSGFIISMMMIYIAIDIFKNSIVNILNHKTMILDIKMILVMLISIGLKFGLYLFYKNQYKKLNSDVILASAQDSKNDVLISIGILFSFFLKHQFNLELDAYIALLIGVFILISSVKLLKGFIDELVGIRPNQTLINAVAKIVRDNEDVLSYHDLLIHEYGDHTYYGTIHLEVDERFTLNKAHMIADEIETRVKNDTGVELVSHLDPIDIVGEESKMVYHGIKAAIKAIDESYSFHDLRIVDNTVNLDVVIFEKDKDLEKEILNKINQALQGKYDLDVTFDLTELKDDIKNGSG